jgi:SOS response regulatory protein OraA/RecX
VSPTVTRLHERRHGRVAVELDGRPWRVLPTDAVVRTGLVVGCRLDRDRARKLAREVRRARALTAATRSLAAGDRSRRALGERLARAGHPAAAREAAIAALDRSGLLDDARLAQNRAERLAERGYGDAAIRVDLRRRRFGEEAAEQAVAALEPEQDRAACLLERKGLTPQVVRRLASRGFSRETLDAVATAFAQEA